MIFKSCLISLCMLVLACNGSDQEKTTSGGPVALAKSEQATTTAGGQCTDPALYGALPDDGQDDRAQVQQAIDEAHDGGTICFRNGTYQFSRVGGTSPDRTVSLVIRGAKNIHLTGAGRQTVLEMDGDGGAGDWYLIHIYASSDATPVKNVEITSLTLSGAKAVNTEEQTHLIGIGVAPTISIGTVEGVSIHDVYFYHPFRKKQVGDTWVNEKGGDCIRILGAYDPNRLTQGQPDPVDKRSRKILISHNQFIECDRSSIGVQRGVFEVIIDGNLFVDVGDQHIDMEPTGAGGIGQFVISNNIFMGGHQGDHHVAIVGNDDLNPAEDIVFSDNVLVGRGLSLMNVRRVTVSGNFISSVAKTSEGVINAIKTIDQLIIENNNIHRLPGSITGSVVRFIHHNTGMPGRSSIRGNQIYQDGQGQILDLQSVQNISVSDNDLYFGGAANTYSGIRIQSTARIAKGITVNQNRLYGPLKYGIHLVASPNAFGSATVVGNVTEGVPTSLRCEGTGGFTKPIVHSAFNYDGATPVSCASNSLVDHLP